MGLCRSTGVKVTSCQSWRFEKKFWSAGDKESQSPLAVTRSAAARGLSGMHVKLTDRQED